MSSLISQNNKLIANSSGPTTFKISAFDFDSGDRGTFTVGNAANGQVSIDGNTITYTPNGNSVQSDSFEVSVSDRNGGSAKQRIDVVIGSPATPSTSLMPLSGSDKIDMMLNGYKWYGKTIYYSFSFGTDGTYPADPKKIEQDFKFIFESAFGNYIDVEFVFVGYFESPEYAYYSGSNINIALDKTNFSDPNYLGIANFPVLNTPLSTFPTGYRGSEGDVFININGPANTLTYEPGSEGFLLLLHEIGHALGLKHPHDDGGSGRPKFSELKLSNLDIDWWTIMSYDDDSASLYYWDPTTPMVLDVIALQYLYGSSNNAAGNNVYDLRFNLPAYFTIFDSAGSDILDFRNAAEAVYVELPTLWISSFQEYPIGIAEPLSDSNRSAPTYLTWLYGDFEELQGSAYSDAIIGSQNADKLFGNAGNDAIRGGQGSDTIDGGSGTDTAFFADLFSDCAVTFDGDQCIVTTKTEGTDRLVNIEKLSFGPSGSAVEYAMSSLRNRNPSFPTVSQSTSTSEDTTKTIPVTATDADGDALKYSVATAASKGTVSLSGSTAIYTPNKDYNGADSFVLRVSDGKGGTATQTINVTVTAVNDAPTFSASSQSVSAAAGTAKTITLAATDVDGDALTYTVATPGKGTATISGSTLTYTPTSSASGTDSFVVTARDPSGLTATQTINVTVEASTTRPDTTAPTVAAFSPAEGATSVAVTSDVALTYSEAIQRGTGTIQLRSGSATGAIVESFDVATSPRISSAGSTLTIDPTTNLAPNTTYFVTMGAGVVKDVAGNGAAALAAYDFVTGAASNTIPPAPTPSDWMLLADDGQYVRIGGKGQVFGTSEFQNIIVASYPGSINFDGSFNRGGDIVTLSGNASGWQAIRQGSSVVMYDGKTFVQIPAGTAGSVIEFDDGLRTLRIDANVGAIKIGIFVVGDQYAQISSAPEQIPLPPGYDPSAVGILLLSEGKEVIVGGDLQIFGTSFRENVVLEFGNVILDGSFNRGGDRLLVLGNVASFSGKISGSSVVLEGGDYRIQIPFGLNPMELACEDRAEILRFDANAGAVYIGDQAMTATAAPLTFA